jgi:hypothetical protein
MLLRLVNIMPVKKFFAEYFFRILTPINVYEQQNLPCLLLRIV